MQTNKNLIPSGLYDTPFYVTEFMSVMDVDSDIIEFNIDLAYQYLLNRDYYENMCDEDFKDELQEEFYNKVFMYNYYRKVDRNNYSEEDAYKCDLIPFIITGDDEDTYCLALALGGCGMDLSPRLDVYYFLQTGNMDPASTYFTDKDYFKSLVSDEIFNAIEAKFGGVK